MSSNLVFLLEEFSYSDCSGTQSATPGYNDLAVGLVKEEDQDDGGERKNLKQLYSCRRSYYCSHD